MKKILLLAALGALCCACATTRAFHKGEKAVADQNMDLAVQYFRQALSAHPENVRYRFNLSNALISASNIHMRRGDEYLAAGDSRMALVEFQSALEFNPENIDARQKKLALLKRLDEERGKTDERTKIEKIKEKASQEPEEQLKKLDPTGKGLELAIGDMELKQLFMLLEKNSGITILLDEKVPNMRVRARYKWDYFESLLDKILLQNNLFYKVVDSKTIIVAPDNPAKREEYDELILRTFFLSHVEPKDMLQMLQQVLDLKRASINLDRKAVTIRDTPEKIKLAEKFIAIQDRPKAELLVDVAIIEVNRSRMKQYGIELSQYQVLESFAPGALPSTDQTAVFRGNMFRYVNSSDFVFTLPSMAYKLLQEDSQSHIKANPQLRGLDNMVMKLMLGDKVPIPVTTFVPAATTPGTSPYTNQPITSFQQQDVGIKIEMTPSIHHDGWVTLKMKFEFTFITSPGTTTLPPTIGTRSVETTIRLRDNETGMLAGLLRDTERQSLRGFPFLSDLPVIKQLFSSNQRTIEQTDIILTLTPRIIKLPDIQEEDLSAYWAGTQQRVGLKTPPQPSPFKKPEAKPTAAEAPAKQEAAPARTVPAKLAASAIEGGRPPADASSSLAAPAAKEGGKVPAKLAASAIEGGKAAAEMHLVAMGQAGPAGTPMPVGAPVPVATGKPIPIAIVGDCASGIGTLEFEVRFSASDLQAESIEAGDFVKTTTGGAHFLQTFDNQAGVIRITLTHDQPGPLKNRELARLVFEARRPGQPRLEIVNIRWRDAGQHEIAAVAANLTLLVGTD